MVCETLVIDTLAGWNNAFGADGLARRYPGCPTVYHLDIDIRFASTEYDFRACRALDLPRVAILTLRGGEFDQTCNERVLRLAEVLRACSPIEVRWIYASFDKLEQLSLAMTMVNPLITAVGKTWRARGCFKRLVLQGGLAVSASSVSDVYGPTLDSSSALGRTEKGVSYVPKKTAKLDDRREVDRACRVQSRGSFPWAFADWDPQHIIWEFPDHFAKAAVKTALEHFFRHISQGIVESVALPALVELRGVPAILLLLPPSVEDYLYDCVTFNNYQAEYCLIKFT